MNAGWTYTDNDPSGTIPADERTFSADELDDQDGWTEALALAYLTRDGGRVPCSRYGYDAASCAPVAYRLASIIADANGTPIDTDSLDHAMGLVVNDHQDVQDILTEHGGMPEDYAMAAYECSICGEPHGESAHGEPLILRELHQRTLAESVSVFLDDALSLVDGIPTVGDITFAGRVYVLMNVWNRERTDPDTDPSEYLDDIDTILSDAGFHAITDPDQGTWCVYRPVSLDAPVT